MSKNLPATVAPEEMIVRVRGHAVILDTDLANLYGVETRQINQQVKRNQERFPNSFAFQLTKSEWDNLRSQNVISRRHGGRRYMPYVFTEHGVLMAANVLNSSKAIETSVAVVEAFVKLRRMALSVEGIARKLIAMENKYDKQFGVVFKAIRKLMAVPPKPKALAPPETQVKGFSSKKS